MLHLLAFIQTKSISKEQRVVLQVPACAGVRVPPYSFPEKFSSFSFTTLLTKAEVIAALVKVRTECNKVRPLDVMDA